MDENGQNLQFEKGVKLPPDKYTGTFGNKEFMVVSGRGNYKFVDLVAEHLRVVPVYIDTKSWENGCPRCIRPDGRKGCNRPDGTPQLDVVTFAQKMVFIIANLQYRGEGSPIEELELMFQACQGASEIHLLITWLCGKDDIAHRPGQIPTIAWMTDRIKRCNPTSVNWFDPHQSAQAENFFPLRRRRFYFLRPLIEKARSIGIDQIASTDWSSSKRAEKVESFLRTGNPLIAARKDHDYDSPTAEISRQQLNGRMVGKKIGLFDDMILGGGTIKTSALSLKAMGAPEIHAFAAQFDPTVKTFGNIRSALSRSGGLTSLTVTNSNPIPDKFKRLRGFQVLDVSEMVADVAKSIIMGQSTSPYFDDI